MVMAVFSRWRDEIGKSVQELERREFDDTFGSRPRGLSAPSRADPIGGLVSRQPIAEASDVAVRTADQYRSRCSRL
jgi:hypothetical protein